MKVKGFEKVSVFQTIGTIDLYLGEKYMTDIKNSSNTVGKSEMVGC